MGICPPAGARELLSRCRAGEVGVLVTFGLGSTDQLGGLRLRQKPGFLLVVDAVETALSRRADVVLPGAFWMEDEGTFINPEGRLQRVAQALEPTGGSANWEVVKVLAEALGAEWQYESVDAVFAELGPSAGWDVKSYDELGPDGILLAEPAGLAVLK